jgi:uncharacterized protein (DUF2252 family)
MTTIAKRIKQFNTGRNPKFLAQKYKNMRQNAFVFYRGSCHLFYQDLPANSFLAQSPASWICGDLHLENFGCYKADNRAIYFDINDFDEAILAPCLFDVARILTSIVLAADTLKTDLPTAIHLCKSFLKVYTKTLQKGSARLMEEKLAQGDLKNFLQDIQTRKRKAFINSHTVKKHQKRKLLIDDNHVSKVSKAKKQQISETIKTWAQDQPNPEFYKVLDVGYRIAGTGSLGLERYVLLVKGNGKGEHYLLDMKIANPSCLNPYLKLKQPLWKNEADRIVQVQKRMQFFPQALLHKVEFDQRWFVLKELQPSQDKMDLTICKGKADELKSIINTFAAIVAWDQLRSGGRQGSATIDELINFAGRFSEWNEALMNYSVEYAKQVEKDYQEYCEAYDSGFFNDELI